MNKKVVIHLGPHKTGSTAIQTCLQNNSETLRNNGILFLHDSETHQAAISLARYKHKDASKLLSRIATKVNNSEESTIILSQEDFCGDLPGRSKQPDVYPHFLENLRMLKRVFTPHDVEFVFFARSRTDWLISCYHQHLKHRTVFSSSSQFLNFYKEFPDWPEFLEGAVEEFGASLHIVSYREEAEAGVQALIEVTGKRHINLQLLGALYNVTPSLDVIKLLERVNELSSFKQTAWFAKKLIMQDWHPRKPIRYDPADNNRSTDLARIAMPQLTKRATARIPPQDADDILPPVDVNLDKYVFLNLPEDVPLPDVSRSNMKDQSKLLDYHLRGKSQLAKLNALSISYLRRNTAYTHKAKLLFHRIWNEKGVILINELSTRWLISTLQTFSDHGCNEHQRKIGATGYFYANLIKIYEGERALEGRDPEQIYEFLTPQTKNRFRGLDRYSVGGTDLLLNLNAILLEIAMTDDVAGLVLYEFILRTKEAANVFTRLDATRAAHDINVPGFEDTWAFFEKPT